MNLIANKLREVADKLPANGDEADASGLSHYICDLLWDDVVSAAAKAWLSALGMSTGFGVFGNGGYFYRQSVETQEDEQSRRYAWLLFAADLAEEFGIEIDSDVLQEGDTF